MTTVRCVVHPGWIEVSGPGVHAVVAAADRHAEALTDAAQGGMVGLLEALTAHGLGGAPDLAAVTVADDTVRVVVRGAGAVVLADGTRVTAQGREPWRDLDVDAATAGGEVSLEAPEPENPRGWRRPARLNRPVVVPTVEAPPDERPSSDQLVDPRGMEDEGSTMQDEAAPPSSDQLVDPGAEDEGSATQDGTAPPSSDQLVDPGAEGEGSAAQDGTASPSSDLLVDSGGMEDDSAAEERPSNDQLVDSGAEDEGSAAQDGTASPSSDLLVDSGEMEDDSAADERPSSDLLVDSGAEDEGSAAEEAPSSDLSVDPGEAEDADAVRAQPDLTLPPPDEASSGLPPASRVPVSAPPKGGLIDSVPWRRGAGGPAPTQPPTAELPVHTPPPPPPPVVDGPLTPPVGPEPSEPGPGPEHTIHDLVPEQGASEVVDEHAAPDVTTDRGALHRSDDDLDRPVVLAVLCPAGHPSPPHAGTCRTCGREIPPQQPFQTPRPALGVLRISTGGVVPLDRGVLLGRAPRVNEELPANQRPHLLRVGGPERDISRNHAEVVLEGWHVLVRDLGSTNGTTVTLPGQEPVRLRPTEDHGIEPGAVITLADEVSLTYEVDG